MIEPTRGWVGLQLREFLPFRELFQYLVSRDIKIRYRQTAFGVAWVLVQPLVMMGVIALFFGVVIKVPSDGVPYPVFVFSALLPWTFFAQSLGQASMSLVTNEALVSKIYLPRLMLPAAAAASFLLDLLVGMVLLFVMMALYGYWPSVEILLLPAFTLLCALTCLGTGLILSAANVRYRDIQAGLPLLTQVWLFASPVAYPLSLIPDGLQPVYGLNPMATVISGFRWVLLGTSAPSWAMVGTSLLVATVLLAVGVAYFRHTERTFADVI